MSEPQLMSVSEKISLPKRRKQKKKRKANATSSKISVDSLITKAMSSVSLENPVDTMKVPGDRLRSVDVAIGATNDFRFPVDDNSSVRSKSLKSTQHNTGRTSVNSISTGYSHDSHTINSELTRSSIQRKNYARLTNREMLSEITRRAKKNLAPPSYVPSFHDLVPAQLTWNKKLPKVRTSSFDSSQQYENNQSARSLSSSATFCTEVSGQESQSSQVSQSFSVLSSSFSLQQQQQQQQQIGAGQQQPHFDRLQPTLQHPPINIIGCMHPIELILACADSRTRKRTRALRVKQRACEEKTRAIDAAIQLKFSRAERYAAALERKQRQIAWLRLLCVTRWLGKLHELFSPVQIRHQSMQAVAVSALRIQRFCRHWYERHLFMQVHLKFLRMFRRHEMLFRMHIRIRRKRMAIARVKTFLCAYKNHHQVSRVVHKYLEGVRRVQTVMRDFLSCKRGKMVALGKMWDKLETRYILRKLDERKAQKRGLALKIQAHNAAMAAEEVGECENEGEGEEEEHVGNFNFLDGGADKKDGIDSRSRIEMRNQARLWAKIDGKMEAKVRLLREQSVIVQEGEAEAVGRLALPKDVRDKVLGLLIETLRKEFYSNQRAIVRRQLENDAVFNPSHAAALLRGHCGELDRLIADKFDKSRVIQMPYRPFLLFHAVTPRMVYDKVREAHRRVQTFKIKIDRNSVANIAGSKEARKRLQMIKDLANS